MNDIFIRTVSLPQSVHGFVMEDPAGDYNIYINQDDSEERQIRALFHEVMHIKGGHLHDDVKTVDEKEQEASYGYLRSVR